MPTCSYCNVDVENMSFYPKWCVLSYEKSRLLQFRVSNGGFETPDVSDAVVVPVPVVSDAHGLELDFGQKSTLLKRRSNESAVGRAGWTQDAQTRGLHTNELGFDSDARVPEVDDLRAADLLGVSGERVPPDSIIQDTTEGTVAFNRRYQSERHPLKWWNFIGMREYDLGGGVLWTSKRCFFAALYSFRGIQIKHSVIDVSDSTIITAKDKENAEMLNFTPYWRL